MTKCYCTLQSRFPCRECRELAEREDAIPYYGDCESNTFDEMLQQSQESYDTNNLTNDDESQFEYI
jgi:hypothetical protein